MTQRDGGRGRVGGCITQAPASTAPNLYLLDTGGTSPPAAAARARTLLGPGAQISDIAATRRTVGSSLTSVDLAGLTRIELGFAVALAAGLVLALGLIERRRTFAITAALGARGRQIGAFVWAEAGFVTIGGLICGAAGRWALAEMLVRVLTGVFDPSPVSLAVPWGYLSVVGAAALAAVITAANRVIAATHRPAMAILRDL